MSITMSLLTFGLFTACGDKEEDTATTTDTATTEETDTEDTSTEETDTEETDTEDPVTDADGDGFESDEDCNDDDAMVNPDADDTVGDAVDNNCDGIDGLDTDGDGYAAIASGGDDCADDNPDRNPGAAEIEGDFVDQDCSFLQLNLDTTCSDATTVRLTGPWWGWDAAAGPEATDVDGDGIFSVEFENVLEESFEYKWIVNEEFEADLINAGFCADVTNPAGGYANRIWLPGDGNTTEYPGTCFACDQTDWTSQQPVVIDVHTDVSAIEAKIVGAFWGWDPNAGPVGTKIADGHFQFTFDPAPGENMEFIFHVDGASESLIGVDAGPTCSAINTDYNAFFNRFWLVGSGDQCYEFNTCGACPSE